MATDPERFLAQYGWIVGKTIASLGLSGDPEVEDLEQEARLALLKAAHAFNPRLGKKFSSFAIPRVRGAILEFRRSKASWVRRTGQKVRARVEVAIVALELRGEEPTPETIRALLADPRDYDRAAALPVLVPLLSEDDEPLYEELPDDGPELVQVVWSRENEALIERAIKRLCAVDRAVFRGRVQRDMKAREVAAVLDIPPAEVTRRLNKTLSLLRRYLDRVAARFVSKPPGINLRRNMKPRGRPAGVQKAERVNYLADAETRERSLQLAYVLNVSEAEVHRRAIGLMWENENRGGTQASRKE